MNTVPRWLFPGLTRAWPLTPGGRAGELTYPVCCCWWCRLSQTLPPTLMVFPLPTRRAVCLFNLTPTALFGWFSLTCYCDGPLSCPILLVTDRQLFPLLFLLLPAWCCIAIDWLLYYTLVFLIDIVNMIPFLGQEDLLTLLTIIVGLLFPDGIGLPWLQTLPFMYSVLDWCVITSMTDYLFYCYYCDGVCIESQYVLWTTIIVWWYQLPPLLRHYPRIVWWVGQTRTYPGHDIYCWTFCGHSQPDPSMSGPLTVLTPLTGLLPPHSGTLPTDTVGWDGYQWYCGPDDLPLYSCWPHTPVGVGGRWHGWLFVVVNYLTLLLLLLNVCVAFKHRWFEQTGGRARDGTVLLDSRTLSQARLLLLPSPHPTVTTGLPLNCSAIVILLPGIPGPVTVFCCARRTMTWWFPQFFPTIPAWWQWPGVVPRPLTYLLRDRWPTFGISQPLNGRTRCCRTMLWCPQTLYRHCCWCWAFPLTLPQWWPDSVPRQAFTYWCLIVDFVLTPFDGIGPIALTPYPHQWDPLPIGIW